MIFDKIVAVIASNQVEILSTLRTGDMSDDPFLPLVAGICYPFNLLKKWRLPPLIPNFSHTIKLYGQMTVGTFLAFAQK